VMPKEKKLSQSFDRRGGKKKSIRDLYAFSARTKKERRRKICQHHGRQRPPWDQQGRFWPIRGEEEAGLREEKKKKKKTGSYVTQANHREGILLKSAAGGGKILSFG